MAEKPNNMHEHSAATKRGKHARPQAPSSGAGLKVAAVVLGLCVCCAVGGGLLVYRGAPVPFGHPATEQARNSQTASSGADGAVQANATSGATLDSITLDSTGVSDKPLGGEAARKQQQGFQPKNAQEGAADAATPQDVSASAREQAETEQAATQNGPHDEEQDAIDLRFSLTGDALAGQVPGDGLATFGIMSDREAPSLAPEAHDALAQAAQAVEDAGYSCGFALVDLQTGRGISYNAQEPLYTASAFKAAFTYYLLTHDYADGVDEFGRENIEAAILYSDNDAYDALTFPHMGQDYIDWQESYGIAYDGWTPFYPYASAESMLRIWADIYQFLQSGEEDAQWFGTLLENTNISFIRNGLEDVNAEARVRNKGGWLADEEYDAVADCGIVELQGGTYLVAILTNQPSTGSAQAHVAAIARALFEAKDALA